MGGVFVPPDVLTQGYGGDHEGQDEEEEEEGDGEDVVCGEKEHGKLRNIV